MPNKKPSNKLPKNVSLKAEPVKDDAYYEALNRRLIAAITTLTGVFILIGLMLYFFLA